MSDAFGNSDVGLPEHLFLNYAAYDSHIREPLHMSTYVRPLLSHQNEPGDLKIDLHY